MIFMLEWQELLEIYFCVVNTGRVREREEKYGWELGSNSSEEEKMHLV